MASFVFPIERKGFGIRTVDLQHKVLIFFLLLYFSSRKNKVEQWEYLLYRIPVNDFQSTPNQFFIILGFNRFGFRNKSKKSFR